jgi:hypothetical protein
MDYNAIATKPVMAALLSLGWEITKATTGANQAGSGLFLIPVKWAKDPILTIGSRCSGFPPIGDWKIIFELFRLDSGNVKLSARCRYMDGVHPFPSFDALDKLANGLSCSKPRNNPKAKHTKSVAAWPAMRPTFASNDFSSIADWLIAFIGGSAPDSFKQFVDHAYGKL